MNRSSLAAPSEPALFLSPSGQALLRNTTCSSDELSCSSSAVLDGERARRVRQEFVKNLPRAKLRDRERRTPATAVGKEAAEFTRETVQGKKVRLEYEHRRVDRHGRTLAEKAGVIRD